MLHQSVPLDNVPDIVQYDLIYLPGEIWILT